MDALMITQSELKTLFSYDVETGIFTRLIPSGTAKQGDVAGYTNSTGYTAIKVKGKSYLAHRLAWLYVHGKFPSEFIDHINLSRTDNRLCNLRCATNSENQQNLSKAKSMLGIDYRKCMQSINKWRARIMLNGKSLHIGYYPSKEDAQIAYFAKKRELHSYATI